MQHLSPSTESNAPDRPELLPPGGENGPSVRERGCGVQTETETDRQTYRQRQTETETHIRNRDRETE